MMWSEKVGGFSLNSYVLFGGSGFIGIFFAQYVLNNNLTNKVYLFDNEPLSSKESEFRKRLVASESRIVLIEGDVRKPIEWKPEEPIT